MNEHTPDGPKPSVSVSSWSDQFLPKVQNASSGKHVPLLTTADIRGILFRQRLLIAGVIGIALLIGLVFTLFRTPIYEASSTVRIDPWGTNIVEGQDIAPSLTSNEVYRYMETQGSVIESKRIARSVMELLNLAENEAFLSADILNDHDENLSGEATLKLRQDAVIAKLRANVTAEVPLNNRIVPIKFRSDNAELSAKIANAYADAFVRDDTRRNLQVNQYALEYLQEQIDQIRARVQSAELAANEYARQHGIINQTTGSDADESYGGFRTFYGPTITASNLANVNESYVSARAERIVAEQRWLAIANVPTAHIREVQENRVIQELEQSRFDLLRQLSDLEQRYNDNYPAVQELKAQVESIDREIARVGDDIKNGIRNDFEIAARQERGMQAELKAASNKSMVEQDQRVRYNLLEREAAALRTQLASLLNRYNEIATAANIQTGNITRLDDANIPTAPVSPNFLLNLIIALFGGIGLAAILVVLRETFDDRLRSFEEIEDRLGFPHIGHTPFVDENSVHEQLEDTFSPLAEAYSSILINIDFSIPRDRNVLQFTSSQASEGKTTTSLTLARAFARQGRKTLLVDADLRKPSIARQFGHDSPDAGIAEILLGHIDQENTYLSGTPDNLDVIPVGNLPPSPVDLLSSDKLAEFIARNRDAYSVIIFDTSPVMGIADAALIARHVDATIFVVEANRVQFGQARAALRRLKANGASIAGLILSKYRALPAGETYDYQNQYYVYSSDKSSAGVT